MPVIARQGYQCVYRKQSRLSCHSKERENKINMRAGRRFSGRQDFTLARAQYQNFGEVTPVKRIHYHSPGSLNLLIITRNTPSHSSSPNLFFNVPATTET